MEYLGAPANWESVGQVYPRSLDFEVISLLVRLAAAPADQKVGAQQILDGAKQQFSDARNSHKTDGQVVAESEILPENAWVKVRFLDKHTVDVDAAANLGAINSKDYFDSEGRAQVSDLQRGERDEDGKFEPADAEFEIDDLAVFHKEAADQLVADGVCEVVDSTYVRRLNDFGYAFRYHIERMDDLKDDIVLENRDIKILTDANQKLDRRITAKEEEKAHLEDDVAAVNRELEAIAEYQSKLAGAKAEKLKKLSLLYRSNKEMADKLQMIHDKRLALHDAKTKRDAALAEK